MGDAPEISPQQALVRARGAARLGRFGFTNHAVERMHERGAQAEDVRAAVQSAKSATWDPGGGTWRLGGGRDAEGIELEVVVSIQGTHVRVVTVF